MDLDLTFGEKRACNDFHCIVFMLCVLDLNVPPVKTKFIDPMWRFQ